MAGFEVLMKQVRAMGMVTGSLGGHVTTMFSGMLTGQMASPGLRSHLVLGHIQLLTALLGDVPSLDEFDFDMVLGTAKDSQGANWEALMRNQSRVKDEIETIRETVEGLREAIAEVQAELYAMRNVVGQIDQVLGAVNQSAEALNQSKQALQQTVIPEVERLLRTLEELLERYRAELQAREFKLWQLNRVFRFRAPYQRHLKVRRQKRLAEEKKAKGEKDDKEDKDDKEEIPPELIPETELEEKEQE